MTEWKIGDRVAVSNSSIIGTITKCADGKMSFLDDQGVIKSGASNLVIKHHSKIPEKLKARFAQETAPDTTRKPGGMVSSRSTNEAMLLTGLVDGGYAVMKQNQRSYIFKPGTLIDFDGEVPTVFEKLVPFFSQPQVAMKKGDTAQFLDEANVVQKGIVLKGGSKSITINMGNYEARVSADFVRKSEVKLTAENPPSVMDRWSVSKYTHYKAMSEETPAYTGEISLNGKVVIHAKNNGKGGSDRYHGIQNMGVVNEFEDNAKTWAAENGWPDMFEAASAWIAYDALYKPAGITAKAYIDEFNSIILDDEPEAPAMGI